MAWLTVASATLDAENNGWSGYTIRQVINAAAITNVGNGSYRVTFNAGITEGLKIGKAYIGMAADSGDAYDFSATPTPLLFSGVANKTIAANGSATSDPTSLNIIAGKNILISMFITSDSANDMIKWKVSLANWHGYYKSGVDEAATVNVTGYSTGNSAYIVSLVESSLGGTQVIMWS